MNSFDSLLLLEAELSAAPCETRDFLPALSLFDAYYVIYETYCVEGTSSDPPSLLDLSSPRPNSSPNSNSFGSKPLLEPSESLSSEDEGVF